MKKKLLVLICLILTLALCFAFAACNNSDEQSNNQQSEQSADPTPSPDPDPDPAPTHEHTYGEWIAEVPATCESAGVKGHYHCDGCNKDFDAEKAELASLVISAKGHTYGEWIAEVPATCESVGTKGHYHCSACNKDFDAEKAELASLTITALGHDYDVTGKCKRSGCTKDVSKTLTIDNESKDVTFIPAGDKIYFNFTTISEYYFDFDTETQQKLESEITEDTPCLVKTIKLYKDGDFENEIALSRDTDFSDYYYFYWESVDELESNTKYYCVVTLDKEYDEFIAYFYGIEKYYDSLTFDSLTASKVYDGQPFTVTATSSKGLDVIVEYSTDKENWTTTAPIDAGTYFVKAYTEDTATIEGNKIETTIKINQKELSLTWNAPNDLVYSGLAKAPTVTVSGVLDGEDCGVVQAVTDGKNNFNVGTFTFTATGLKGADKANYKLPTNAVSPEYTIAAKDLVISNLHATYNGTTAYTGIKIGATNTNSIGKAADYDTIEIDLTLTSGSAPLPGTISNMYNGKDGWCVAVSKENENYNVLLDETNAFTFVIDKVELNVKAVIGAEYNGSEDQTVSIDITDDMCSNLVSSLALGTSKVQVTIPQATKVGEYTNIEATIIDSDNYILSEDSEIIVVVYIVGGDLGNTIFSSNMSGRSFTANESLYFKITCDTADFYTISGSGDLAVTVVGETPVVKNIYKLGVGTYYLKATSLTGGYLYVQRICQLAAADADLYTNTGYVDNYNSTGETSYYKITISDDGIYQLTSDNCLDATIVGETKCKGGYYYLVSGDYVLSIYVNSEDDNLYVKLGQIAITSEPLNITDDLIGNGSYIDSTVVDGNTYYYYIDITLAGVYDLSYDDDSDKASFSILGISSIDSGVYYNLSVGRYIIKLDVATADEGDVELLETDYQLKSLTVGSLDSGISLVSGDFIFYNVNLAVGDYELAAGTTGDLEIYCVFKAYESSTISVDDYDSSFSITTAGTYYIIVCNYGADDITDGDGSFGISMVA